MDRKILEELGGLPMDAPAQEVRRVQGEILRKITESGPARFMPFAPHFGVAPLPKKEKIPEVLAKRSCCHPLLIGCNAREASAYIGGKKGIAALDRFPLTRRAVEAILKRKGEEIFEGPSRAFARQYSRLGGQCWYYEFYWGKDRSAIGACHCMELVPLFGGKGLEGHEIMMGYEETDVRDAGRQIRKLWTDFSRTGMVQDTRIEDMLTVTEG